METFAEIFPWDDNFNTGIHVIDEQHHILVRLLNKLATHFASHSSLEVLDEIFQELADYATHHFQTEEAVWRKSLGDSDLEIEHKKFHDSFLVDLLRIKSDDTDDPIDKIIGDVLKFLTHWLALHILENDRYMALVVLNLHRGLSLEEANTQAKVQMSGATRLLIDAILKMYDTLSTKTIQLTNEIAARKRAENELILAHKVFATTLDAICVTDFERNIVEVNQAFEKEHGVSSRRVIGKRIEEFKSGLVDNKLTSKIWRHVNRHGSWSGEIRNKTAKSELEINWLTVSSIGGDSGKVTNYVFVFSNVSQLIKRKSRLEYSAHYDDLTGLPNRTLLRARMDLAIAQAKRTGESFAACFLDLDAFKIINDQHGHEAGDIVLRQVSKRLKSVMRDIDTVARLGGDEFVILIANVKTPEECLVVLERILKRVQSPINIGVESVLVNASIGVAMYPSCATDAELLLKMADSAMYATKKNGVNGFEFSCQVPDTYDRCASKDCRFKGS